MNPERFNKSTPGRLIQTVYGGKAFTAFLPNPLPPEIPNDEEMWRTLSKADRSLGELAGLGRSLVNPNLSRFRGMRNTPQLAANVLGGCAPGYRAACRAVVH
jgi:hypothetical protein